MSVLGRSPIEGFGDVRMVHERQGLALCFNVCQHRLGAIPALIEALGDSNRDVRSMASMTLKERTGIIDDRRQLKRICRLAWWQLTPIDNSHIFWELLEQGVQQLTILELAQQPAADLPIKK